MSRTEPVIEDQGRRLVESQSDDERQSLLRSWVNQPDSEARLFRLKEESERYLNIDPRVALTLAESLVVGADLADRSEHRALGLLATGDALRALGRCLEALDAFDAAGTAFLARDDEVGWARSRIGRLFALILLGRTAEGLSDAERARAILIRHEQWLRAGSLSLNLGLALSELGRFDDALPSYDQALAFYEQARQADPTLHDTVEIRMAKAYAMKADVSTIRGDSHGALAFHEMARAVFARYDDSLSVLREDQHIALVYEAQGHYTRSLRLFTDVYALFTERGLDADAGQAALDLIECYLNLNQVDRALEVGAEAVSKFEGVGLVTWAARARFLCAVAAARRGDSANALELLERAAHTFADAGLEIQFGLVALQRASLFLDQDNRVAAADAARLACDLFAERRLVAPLCQAHLIWARALLADGNDAGAEALVGRVLDASEIHDLPAFEPESHRLLAAVARHRGETATTLQELRTAIASIERIQGRIAAELRPHFLGDKARVFHEAIELCLQEGRIDLAFTYLERAKSRVLADYLNGNLDVRPPAPDEATRALQNELTRLRAEHNSLYDRRFGREAMRRAESATAAGSQSTLRDDRSRILIRDLESRIGRIIERLELRGAPLEAAKGNATIGPYLPSQLPADTVLLEYFFGESAATVFVVADGALGAVPLPAGGRHVRRLLHQWQLNLDATATAVASGQSLAGLSRNARGVLGALYRALLLPVEQLLIDRSRIVVIPYGVTHAVPFQALFSGDRFVAERFEVSVCPSSDLLRLCLERRRERPPSALVVACSDRGRLPAVVDEAREVASLFSGESYVEEEATLAAVTGAAKRHGVVHFAAHGEARLDNPIFAHIKLADGRLTPADIFSLDLDGALVTLSACETGRSVVAGGDELIGLSRGFLHAGAATLVQSMWRVEDGSTAHLMGQFYRSLRAGRTKGAALREAQLGLLDSGGAHPFFWAGFQILGDSGVL